MAAILAPAAAFGAVSLASAAGLPFVGPAITMPVGSHPCPGTATVTNTDVGLSLGTVQVTLPAGCASATTTRTVQVKLIDEDDDEYTSADVTMSAQSQTVAVTPGYTAPGAMTARVTADGWNVPATWSYTVQERRLQLHEPYQDAYLRHRGVGTNTSACSAWAPNGGVCLEESADQNTVFRVVEGLRSPGTTGLVSFESVSNPGYYLRRQDDVVYLLAAPIGNAERGAATFEMTPGLWNAAPPWLSFEAYGTNTYYLRHFNWQFRTDTQGAGDVYRKDATIRFVTP